MPLVGAVRHRVLLDVPRFNPKRIPGLVLWLDASKINNLADGDAVTTWSDLSGKGNDLTQATAAQKPVFKVAIRNGKPVVRFDGVDDRLSAAITAIAQPLTVFIVCTPGSSAAGRGIYGGQGNVNTGMTMAVTTGLISILSATTLEGDVDRSGAWAVFEAVYNTTGSLLIVNGNQDAAGNVGINGTGDNIRVGSRGGEDLFLSGDVAEFIVYDRLVSIAQRRQLRLYLAKKYAIGVV